MTRLTLAERARLVRLTADRRRRSSLSRVLGSPLLRWRYGAPVADELLIIPQDLRATDPSFAGEVEFGHFGLGGAVAVVGSGTPFSQEGPSPQWTRELHGFTWLRHLRAADHAEARNAALALVAEWIGAYATRGGIAWEAAVVGRRLISWIANASILLEDVDQATYDRTTDSLGDQLIHLSAVWRSAPDGCPRLLVLIALVYGNLCIAGHDHSLRGIEEALAAELDRQIFADGGHVSRNPATLVELLLDLLPLRQCFVARERPVPAAIDTAVARMTPMLKFMRLGDGGLARFNGMGEQAIDALSTVLAYGSAPGAPGTMAPQSRYARLERGSVVVVVDAGPPPPLELAAEAHAGCLSFEMSAGAEAMLVNGGAPGPADQDWRPAARATSSHNALSVGGKSSSRLVRHGGLERLLGGAPIRFPQRVTVDISEVGGGLRLDGWHDGFVRRFQLVHRRRLTLDAAGLRLEGRDALGAVRGHLRLKRDVPFSIHFHLHPDASVAPATERRSAEIGLKSGQRWRFTTAGAELSIEESVHYADIAGPRRALQIVLRGACCGESEVSWVVERVAGTPA